MIDTADKLAEASRVFRISRDALLDAQANLVDAQNANDKADRDYDTALNALDLARAEAAAGKDAP